jgi:1-deoxy-D-xylulose-5-phosphate synthase
MLKTAVSCGGPASLRYPRGAGVGVPLDEIPRAIPVGKGEILLDPPEAALSIIAVGSTVHPALAAAELLQTEGLAVQVINARFIKPLDAELLCAAAEKTRRILTVEENALMGGFGSAVLELLAQRKITGCLVRRLGIPDEYAQHATQKELRRLYGIDAEGIASAAREMLIGIGY